MEDTLRGFWREAVNATSVVLILVLMEDTLRDFKSNKSMENLFEVLILVLMEDTLRDEPVAMFNENAQSLNPCFNGRYSQRAKTCVPLFIVV